MKQPFTTLLLTVLAAGSPLHVWGADAADAPVSESQTTDTPETIPVSAIRYPVTIETDNSEITDMLQEHLPLITQQQEDNTLDAEQIGFLAEDAPDQIREMLRTKGFFNAQVSVTPQNQGYLVRVQTGQPSRVDNVNVAILGDILQDENLSAYYKSAMADWALPIGEVFNQTAWSDSKTAVLSAVRRKKYPLAEFSQTEALINPPKHAADLTLTVNSKQPVYFGEIEVGGAKRYPEEVVRGLAQFQPGSPYDLDKLLDYQQALEQDAHYSGASVQADFSRLSENRVPVVVEVSEMKRQKLELGARYDSEYGAGGKIGYDYYDLFGRGYVGSAVVDMDRYESNISLGISQPRNQHGHFWTGSVGYQRSTTQNLKTEGINGGIWYARDRDGIESRIGIEYINERKSIPNENINLDNSHATMLTASWKRQNIESLLRPKNGYYLDFKIGSTLGKLMSSSTIARVNTRAGYYITPENEKLGTWIFRGQVGYVYVKDNGKYPSTLGFRTGGASSVRGYEQDSIGLPGPGNSVLPEQALAVASAEYQLPIGQNFAGAIFHDIGGTADHFRNITFRHGTGVGLRWFSPVAPFSFDIAYGHHDKKIRWHISLGTRF